MNLFYFIFTAFWTIFESSFVINCIEPDAYLGIHLEKKEK